MRAARAPVAEFLGTFLLCFSGIAAILASTSVVGSGAGLVGIALANGLALSVGVNVFFGVSGAHFNPAVTIGMLATRRIPLPHALVYMAAQMAGATAAAVICCVIFPDAARTEANLGIPLPAAWASARIVLTAEFVMAFLLMVAIYGTAIDRRGQAMKIGGFGIGLVVASNILAGGAVTGASMNPARSFGPALVQNFWDWHALYWMAPIAGAVAAALVYEHVVLEKDLKI